jgi:PAS domain S-box-containing protein
MEFVAPGWEPEAAASYAAARCEPDHRPYGADRLPRGDGASIPLEINIVGSMRDGALSAIHGVARDVSERSASNASCTSRASRFRQLVQTSPDVIYRCDATGRFTFMAEGSEALFGYAPAAVLGHDLRRPHRRGITRRGDGQLRAQKTEHDVVRRFRYMVKYHDGTTFPAEITSVSVWEDGTLRGVQGTVRDVTMAEAPRTELRESQERYRFLVRELPGRRVLHRREGSSPSCRNRWSG